MLPYLRTENLKAIPYLVTHIYIAHTIKFRVISSGLIQLCLGWAYKWRGLYPGGLISGIKKKCFETSHSSVDRNTFLREKVIVKQHLALFSTVIDCEQSLSFPSVLRDN